MVGVLVLTLRRATRAAPWQVYWWHDKYRPRKPKYFNRVHTGYEWNKYNQTHYDHDNPPPKARALLEGTARRWLNSHGCAN
jgi:Cactus-binding C-terminus of cactin protein